MTINDFEAASKKETLHVTGHRPKDLGGYDPKDPTNAWLINATVEVLRQLKTAGFKRFITGMALGYDQWSLEAALKVGGFYLIAAVPCAGQESRWPQSSKDQYYSLLEKCDEVHVLADNYSVQAMHSRNEWMVERAVLTLAAYTVGKTAGGTYNCLTHAAKHDNHVVVLDPATKTMHPQFYL